MRKTLIRILAAASVAAAALGLTTGPAQAVNPSRCGGTNTDTTHFCFYVHANFYDPYNTSNDGWRIDFTGANLNRVYNFSTWRAAEGPATFLDNVDSIANNTGYRICLYNNHLLLTYALPHEDYPQLRAASANKADSFGPGAMTGARRIKRCGRRTSLP